MKNPIARKALPLLTTLFAGAALIVCGGSVARELFLGALAVAAIGLLVAVLPLVVFAFLVRMLRGPLDAHPEVRLVVRGERGNVGAGTLERQPAVI